MKIEKITIDSKKYPERLKHIFNPPQAIYVLGDEKILNNSGIAIVGSRKATNYGKNISYNFAKKISEKRINIISGLAIGIDTMAHIGCLEGINGKTIAVLGGGIKKIYPRENIELARKIIKNGGCIISEYEPDENSKKENFQQRNRIISGLSEGILVVEATEKSGSLITVEHGLDQGKNIFAIPRKHK